MAKVTETTTDRKFTLELNEREAAYLLHLLGMTVDAAGGSDTYESVDLPLYNTLAELDLFGSPHYSAFTLDGMIEVSDAD